MGLYTASREKNLFSTASKRLHERLNVVNRRVDTLQAAYRVISDSLADVARDVRHVDLDMVGLEDKVKAFTGRVSVRKRREKKEEASENGAQPLDEAEMNRRIRDGTMTSV